VYYSVSSVATTVRAIAHLGFTLTQKMPTTALVTGVSGGIGSAIVRELQAYDIRVIGTDSINPSIEMYRFDKLDLGDVLAVQRYAAEIASDGGHVNALVNVAANRPNVPITELSAEEWLRLLTVNVVAPATLIRTLSPSMPTGSSIISIGSIRAQRGFHNDSAYAASKGALESMTRALAVELGPRIRVNLVAPGAIDTPMSATALNDPDTKEAVLARIPSGRIGESADVAHAVRFLLSENAQYITGQVLTVDGGMSVNGSYFVPIPASSSN
jgi:NAD(P)-dependent dehydrogenase (short-subunit alcohol dehydrogenase family)